MIVGKPDVSLVNLLYWLFTVQAVIQADVITVLLRAAVQQFWGFISFRMSDWKFNGKHQDYLKHTDTCRVFLSVSDPIPV